ncbi:adenylate/guanylate cyclase domain-containing protein [Sinorhizobium fredii]|uniref:Adenylate/guanylate cyclase domain-containing protein n=1 Tax=Rhizobium fredii TaxID=380 RepID=A0A2A6LTX8_RHIFR|nr:adenylate/guanylate cyclase domain-containing protein [Sinorhizobium fredii]PDT45672.1 adenylate/guanylate cyclase domain-containing protein [Sinorhizobium fredii]
MQRKLAAILVGDFVASTSAMEHDEEQTIARVVDCMAIIAEIVTRFEGRVFNTAGDAILAEFSSPVNALRAAMEMRGAIGAVPRTSPQDMRFGLHLADVVVVGDDLRGDGVNVAARIEASAEPGQIEVSGPLYDHVRRVSPCAFEAIGERQLKGVSEPVRIYRVGAAMDRHRFLIAPTRAAPPLSVRPNSVVVTPFATPSATDQDQTFLAEGMTDDLTLELSRLKSLFVTSRSASSVLRTADPVEIGKVLGVRYVVAGSVRKAGAQVRVNISLIETGQGHLLWSDRIQRPFAEILDIMDEITARVAATVSGRIEQSELASARLKRPENMSAYEHYLRGLDHHRLAGVADLHLHEAMGWFEKAMQADPGFGRPFAMHVCSWSSLPSFDLEAGEQQTAHALELDPTDPEAHRIMGAIKMKRGDFVASRFHHKRAIELAPNDAYTIGRCAAFYLFAGEPLRALELLDRAETLDPFLPVWITEERVASLYVLDRYEEMFEVAHKLPFQTRRTYLYRVAARMALGDVERAGELVAQALGLDPTLSAEYLIGQELFRDPAILEALMQRNRAAGLPASRDTAACAA